MLNIFKDQFIDLPTIFECANCGHQKYFGKELVDLIEIKCEKCNVIYINAGFGFCRKAEPEG